MNNKARFSNRKIDRVDYFLYNGIIKIKQYYGNKI